MKAKVCWMHFFLGKAVAEALNERIESTIWEILSTLGRLQAEQQKQVQEFQDEVLERAKWVKEKAQVKQRRPPRTSSQVLCNKYITGEFDIHKFISSAIHNNC